MASEQDKPRPAPEDAVNTPGPAAAPARPRIWEELFGWVWRGGRAAPTPAETPTMPAGLPQPPPHPEVPHGGGGLAARPGDGVGAAPDAGLRAGVSHAGSAAPSALSSGEALPPPRFESPGADTPGPAGMLPAAREPTLRPDYMVPEPQRPDGGPMPPRVPVEHVPPGQTPTGQPPPLDQPPLPQPSLPPVQQVPPGQTPSGQQPPLDQPPLPQPSLPPTQLIPPGQTPIAQPPLLDQPPLPQPSLPPTQQVPPGQTPTGQQQPLDQPPLPQPSLPLPHLVTVAQPPKVELSPHPHPPQALPQQGVTIGTSTVEGHVVPPNHEPDFTSPPGDVTEDRNVTSQGFLVAQGRVQVFDPDPGQDHVQPATLTGAYGNLVLAPDGSWTYSARNDLPGIQQLNQGDTLTESFTIHSADGTPQKILVYIHGTDDRAFIESTPLVLHEDVNVTSAGLLTAEGFVAVDGTDPALAHVVPGTIAGTYGTFVVNADGTWRYVAANNQDAIQTLGAGEHLTDTARIHSLGGATHDLHVTIEGTNDAAVISVSQGALVEDHGVGAGGLITVRGTIDVLDHDAGQDHIVPLTGAGQYGTFVVGADGSWRYSAANGQPAIQSLGAGDSLTDSVRIHSADGTTHLLQVSIHGVNDPASFQSAEGHVTEDRNLGPGGALTASGVVIVSDADQGENHLVPKTEDGRFGTFVVQADGSWNYTTDNDRQDIQDLRSGETLVDRMEIQSADGTRHQIQVVIHGADDTWSGRPVTGVVSSGWGGGNHGNHYGWSSDAPEESDVPASPYTALVPEERGEPAPEGPSNPYLDQLVADQAPGDQQPVPLAPELPPAEADPDQAGLTDTAEDAAAAALDGADAPPAGDFDLHPPPQHHQDM